MVDNKIKSLMYQNEYTHSDLYDYLDGLDGDQIAYCTQGIVKRLHLLIKEVVPVRQRSKQITNYMSVLPIKVSL